MSNKSHNNWKSQLGELDTWPGASMPDKNVAFRKLHGRLTGKKSNRKLAWYWTAAACLLIAILTPLVFRQSGVAPVSETATKYPQPKELPAEVSLVPLKKEIVEIKKQSLQTKHVFTAADINKTRKKIIPAGVTNEIRLYDTVSTSDRLNENSNIAVKPVDTALTVVITTIKKTLKVVHVNELGDPVDVQREIAGKKELHSFQLRLASQEVYNGKPVALNKKEFTIFSTKSSPN